MMLDDRVLLFWFCLVLGLGGILLLSVLGGLLGTWLASPAHQWAVVAGGGVTLGAWAWQRWVRPGR